MVKKKKETTFLYPASALDGGKVCLLCLRTKSSSEANIDYRSVFHTRYTFFRGMTGDCE